MADDNMIAEKRSTGSDIGDLQQKISKAERELSQLRLELDQTRQQAKAAEMHAIESGRTNRKLKTEIQTLTDMSNRKDRQAENAKATAFFFEGQVKKYTDEIETAQRGMGHLKELDDQLRDAKQRQQQLEKEAHEEYDQVRETVRKIQEKYRAEKQELQKAISLAYQDLAVATAQTLQVQQETAERIKETVGPIDKQVRQLEETHAAMEKQQLETIRDIQEQVESLLKKLTESEESTHSYEEIMSSVQKEMDRIMGRLRAIDQTEG